MSVPNLTTIIPAPFIVFHFSQLLNLHWNNFLCFLFCSYFNLGNCPGVVINSEWISILATHKWQTFQDNRRQFLLKNSNVSFIIRI